MSYPRPIETALLEVVEGQLSSALKGLHGKVRNQTRLELLGLVSAAIGGYDAEWLGKWIKNASHDKIKIRTAKQLAPLFGDLPMAPGLALAALARPDFEGYQRQQNGAFYTDFRLALHLANGLVGERKRAATLLDPACGSGMLLCAATLVLAKGSQRITDGLLAETICGADLSEQALRGAALSLCSMTRSRAVIEKLISRLRLMDSLAVGVDGWSDYTDGFDAMIANPPWERVRLTRHEFLRMTGADRHYGETYRKNTSADRFQQRKAGLKTYVGDLRKVFELQGSGDVDLYKFFLELMLSSTSSGGRFSILVPAGLIRSQGTQALREALFSSSSDIVLNVFDNKARFFEIDSRFKFLSVSGKKGKERVAKPIRLAHGNATVKGVTLGPAVSIPRPLLARIRPDSSLPEVRSAQEWRLFRDMAQKGRRLGSPEAGWLPEIMREVDMTLDRADFRKTSFDGRVPLVEGRMVHQYRFGIKQYVSGTGRRAVWRPVGPLESVALRPQFYFPVDSLSEAMRSRIAKPRVGFCDISGQTNERTMLAALIPPNVVCGNKVPTVSFDSSLSEERTFAWLAICNSFAFDWLLRRVVTTTINFFHLLDMPFPVAAPNDSSFKILADAGRRLSMDKELTLWQRADLRADADLAVLDQYGLDNAVLPLLLNDFQILDRAQPALPGEARSTITRDFLFMKAAQRNGCFVSGQREVHVNRVKAGRLVGAVPYIPSFLRGSETDSDRDASWKPADHIDSRDLAGRCKEAAGQV